MDKIDLEKIAKDSGESEVEIAKRIITVLAVKAQLYDIPQRVRITCKGREG